MKEYQIINQIDLPEMELSDADKFEMKGRNIETGRDSRMKLPVPFNPGDFVKRQSNTTQLIDSDLSLGEGAQLLLRRTPTGVDYAAHFLGEYGTYAQEELCSTNEPSCVNHGAVADDGTVVGINPIANYKDENGQRGADFIAYLSDVPAKNRRYYADLSEVGRGLSYTFQDVTILISRLDTTTLQIRASCPQDIILPITHGYRGNNTEEALREIFTVGPTGTIIGNVGIGQYVLADFYTRRGEFGYDFTAGSDDDALTQAWLEVKRSEVIVQSQPSERSADKITSYAEDTYKDRYDTLQHILDEMIEKEESLKTKSK